MVEDVDGFCYVEGAAHLGKHVVLLLAEGVSMDMRVGRLC